MTLRRTQLFLSLLVLSGVVACGPTSVGGIPVAVPDAPSGLVAVGGNERIEVAFVLGSDNGSPITGVEFTFDEGVTWADAGATSSPIALTGLTNGETYSIRLRAVNAVGASPASEPVAGIPVAVPDAPSGLVAVGGNERIEVAFVLGSDNGSPITGVEFTFDEGVTWADAGATSSPIALTGLTNGETYSIRLRAVNAVGASAASQPVTATPDPSVWRNVSRVGNVYSDVGHGVATFNDGSAIVTGHFVGTIDFGPHSLTSSLSSTDVFVAKIDPEGTWAWAARGGGSFQDVAHSVTALSDGGAIITGFFVNSAGFGSHTLTSAGGTDVFVAKIDADGTWEWATRAGGGDTNHAYSVSAFSDGSAVVTGYFEGSAAFGPHTLISAGLQDIFVAKIDPSGAWQWAARAGGTDRDEAFGVGSFGDGTAVVTGYYHGTSSFGTHTVTSHGAQDVFVAKIGADGSWQWVTGAGGNNVDMGWSVGTHRDGSAVVTGLFNHTANFGDEISLSGSLDVFVAKIDAQGDWVWATQVSGGGSSIGRAVAVHDDGSALIAGSFSSNAFFGDHTSLDSAGNQDVFVAVIDAEGKWQWATGAGGGSDDVALSVGVFGNGSAIVTGSFSGTATFGGETLSSAGDTDVFVANVNPPGSP